MLIAIDSALWTKASKIWNFIIVPSSLVNLVLHLLHPYLHGGKRACSAALLLTFSSSDLHHFGFWLVTVGYCKDDKKRWFGTVTTWSYNHRTILACWHFARKSNCSATTFVSTDVLFGPIIVSVWKSRSTISENWFRMLPISYKMFSHWS